MNDLTFIIPVRIDSQERLENLNLLIDHLNNCLPDVSIFVLEADKACLLKDLAKDKKIRYEFVHDENPVFFRTHYLNQMISNVTTSRVAIWDTDIIVSPTQILSALQEIDNQQADFVYPYDGRILQVIPFLKEAYKDRKEISTLEHYSSLMSLLFGINSYGGGFIVSREKYIKTGGENENIYGWGPEDLERIKRWQILGYKVSRIPGPAYHLYHPILDNSKNFNSTIGCKNNQELFRICAMYKEELQQEVEGWMTKRIVKPNLLS